MIWYLMYSLREQEIWGYDAWKHGDIGSFGSQETQPTTALLYNLHNGLINSITTSALYPQKWD